MHYRASITTALIVAAAAAPSCTRGRGEQPLVRVEDRQGAVARECEGSTSYFAATALEDREEWYAKHLRALQESPLCALPGAEVYRLTWLPSFHHSIVVRIERVADSYHLTAKRESGAGGYDPGHLAVDTSIVLTSSDVATLRQLLRTANYWDMTTVPPSRAGLDGARWILEGLVRARYHVVDRWTPNDNGPDAAFRALASWMLARSGLVEASLVSRY